MVLASDFPLFGVLASVLYVVMWIVFVLLLVYVIGDVFRAKDMRGIAKAVWLLWILILPFIGVIAYVIVRGDSMAPTRSFRARRAGEASLRGYPH